MSSQKIKYMNIAEIRPFHKNINCHAIVLEKEDETITRDKLHITKFLIADGSASVSFTVTGELGEALKSGDIIDILGAQASLHRLQLTLSARQRTVVQRVGSFFMTFKETPNMSLYNWKMEGNNPFSLIPYLPELPAQPAKSEPDNAPRENSHTSTERETEPSLMHAVAPQIPAMHYLPEQTHYQNSYPPPVNYPPMPIHHPLLPTMDASMPVEHPYYHPGRDAAYGTQYSSQDGHPMYTHSQPFVHPPHDSQSYEDIRQLVAQHPELVHLLEAAASGQSTPSFAFPPPP